jgi:hypothetical protein
VNNCETELKTLRALPLNLQSSAGPPKPVGKPGSEVRSVLYDANLSNLRSIEPTTASTKFPWTSSETCTEGEAGGSIANRTTEVQRAKPN